MTKSPSILVVDDDPKLRRTIQQGLADSSLSAQTAGSVKEALEAIEAAGAGGFQLILLDVMMPKVGGRVVYEAIRDHYPQIRVLFSSGYSMNAIHTNFVLHEGLQLIQKPYQRDDLLRRVREALEGR